MRRWVHIIVPAVSLLLCAACVALWLWSRSEVRYLRADFWRANKGARIKVARIKVARIKVARIKVARTVK